MSKITKRKHLLREAQKDEYEPPSGNQQIVRVLKSPGNNLHQVQAADGSVYLVSMPNKFRQSMYVRGGSYIVIEPIAEGKKVKGEIVRILTDLHIRYFKEDKIWPEAFLNEEKKKNENGTVEADASSERKKDADYDSSFDSTEQD